MSLLDRRDTCATDLQPPTGVPSKHAIQARKKEKGVILDEFTETTGANLDYASRLLQGRYEYTTRPIRHPRAKYYTPEDAAALEHLWELLDGLCSKLLTAAVPQVLLQLRVDGTLDISDTCAQHLLEMSSPTIDRLLAKRRPKGKRRRGFTQAGTFLKRRIPVRTFAERTPDRPGFLDVDLVDHSGGNESGEFAHTLDMVDAYSQWIEPRAVRTQAQTLVLEQLQCTRLDLPFPLSGIHSDGGSEFNNGQLYRYCTAEHLTDLHAEPGGQKERQPARRTKELVGGPTIHWLWAV